MWHVYILRCSDNSYYTGLSINIKDRLKRHNNGTGSEYTKLKRPVKLEYLEKFEDKSQAIRREIEIKKLGIQNKRKLIRFGRGKGMSLATYI